MSAADLENAVDPPSPHEPTSPIVEFTFVIDATATFRCTPGSTNLIETTIYEDIIHAFAVTEQGSTHEWQSEMSGSTPPDWVCQAFTDAKIKNQYMHASKTG